MDLDFGTLLFLAAFLWFLISGMRPKRRPRPGGRPDVRPAAGAPAEPFRISLEMPPEPALREPVAYDDRAAAASRARIEAARARDRALNASDHAAFDRRIRSAPPEAPGPRARPPAGLHGTGLRHAVIWREVLGPPVSLRD